MKQANLIIFASDNGRDGWQPVAPESVPEWVKSPDNIGRMISGEACMKADEGEKGSAWYRAEKILAAADVAALQRATAKRARRARGTVLH